MSFYRPHKRFFTPQDDTLVTKQAFKAECDINNILKQYQKTGLITHIANSRPTYTDLPSDMDYQQSMNTMLRAEEAFAALPSTVRDRYGNDPLRFLGAFGDPSQLAYLREMGLLRPEVAEALPEPVRPPGPDTN